MHIRVFYFAAVRDLVGQSEEVLELPSEVSTASALVDLLTEKHPHLSMEGVRIAINEEFVELAHPLEDGDTVALIPPVSGG